MLNKKETTIKMKIGTRVNVVRSEMAPSLAAAMPSFIFYNEGTVSKVAGDRVEVRYNKEDRYWFDANVVRRSEI